MTANAPIPAIANAIFDACGVRLTDHARSRRSGSCVGWTSCARERDLVAQLGQRLAAEDYLADEGYHRDPPRAVARRLLAPRASRAGATEIAKVLAKVLDREPIRSQVPRRAGRRAGAARVGPPWAVARDPACEAEGRRSASSMTRSLRWSARRWRCGCRACC